MGTLIRNIKNKKINNDAGGEINMKSHLSLLIPSYSTRQLLNAYFKGEFRVLSQEVDTEEFFILKESESDLFNNEKMLFLDNRGDITHEQDVAQHVLFLSRNTSTLKIVSTYNMSYEQDIEQGYDGYKNTIIKLSELDTDNKVNDFASSIANSVFNEGLTDLSEINTSVQSFNEFELY